MALNLCNFLAESVSPVRFEPSNTTDTVLLITNLKDELRSFQMKTKKIYSKHNLIVKPITHAINSVYGFFFLNIHDDGMVLNHEMCLFIPTTASHYLADWNFNSFELFIFALFWFASQCNILVQLSQIHSVVLEQNSRLHRLSLEQLSQVLIINFVRLFFPQ